MSVFCLFEATVFMNHIVCIMNICSQLTLLYVHAPPSEQKTEYTTSYLFDSFCRWTNMPIGVIFFRTFKTP